MPIAARPHHLALALLTLSLLGGCRGRAACLASGDACRADTDCCSGLCDSSTRRCAAVGRDPATVSCTPGASLLVACKEECGVGSCAGDPVLRVCDGVASVTACAEGVGTIADDDDDSANVCSTSGLCPALVVNCPSSGAITVVPRAFSTGRAFSCDWSAMERALPRPAGPDAGG